MKRKIFLLLSFGTVKIAMYASSYGRSDWDDRQNEVAARRAALSETDKLALKSWERCRIREWQGRFSFPFPGEKSCEDLYPAGKIVERKMYDEVDTICKVRKECLAQLSQQELDTFRRWQSCNHVGWAPDTCLKSFPSVAETLEKLDHPDEFLKKQKECLAQRGPVLFSIAVVNVTLWLAARK